MLLIPNSIPRRDGMRCTPGNLWRNTNSHSPTPSVRRSLSTLVPRCLERGVMFRWSFAPTVEGYLKMLLLAAPTSGDILDSYLCVKLV